MRIVIDSLIVMMLVGVVAGIVVMRSGKKADEQGVAQVQASLDRLSEQAAYHTTVQSAMQGKDTMLVHVHEAWFGETLPTNSLLGDEHPWIDLAPPGDLGMHPPDPVATDLAQAGFWYNPTTGVFRARVTPRSSEAQTLARYNQVNGTSLDAFEQIPDPSRAPIAHVPGTTPAAHYASMANQTWNTPKPKASEQTEQLFENLVSSAQAAIKDQQADLNMSDEPDLGPTLSAEHCDRDASLSSESEDADSNGPDELRPTLSK